MKQVFGNAWSILVYLRVLKPRKSNLKEQQRGIFKPYFEDLFSPKSNKCSILIIPCYPCFTCKKLRYIGALLTIKPQIMKRISILCIALLGGIISMSSCTKRESG